MKKILWYSTFVEIGLVAVAAIMVVMTAPAQDKAIVKAEAAGNPGAIPLANTNYDDKYKSGCTHVLTIPGVVYPGDVVTVTAKAAYGGVCGSCSVWMSYAVSATLDGEDAGTSVGTGIYDFCYWGDPQPICPSGVGVNLPDDGTHTITFTIADTLIYSNCVYEITNGTACSSNYGNRKNVLGPAVVMSGNGGTHGWSTVKFYDLWVNQDIAASLNKTTFSTSDHITITADVQPLSSPCYPFVRIVTPGHATYYLTMNEGLTEIPTPYLGTESGAITLPAAITGANILDLTFSGLAAGTYYVESGTISPATTDLSDLKYINGVDRKQFAVQ
jgi:hypothetical protein